MEEVAKGIVIKRRECIHGNTLGEHEVPICIDKLLNYDSIEHPDHGYELIEAKGFTAWKKKFCRKEKQWTLVQVEFHTFVQIDSGVFMERLEALEDI